MVRPRVYPPLCGQWRKRHWFVAHLYAQTLKGSFEIYLNWCNTTLPSEFCPAHIQHVELGKCNYLSMDTLACNGTESWALLGLINYPVGYKPTSNQAQALESNTGFAGLAWASDYSTSVSVELLLIFSGQKDKGAMPKCHKSPFKKSSVHRVFDKQISMHYNQRF